MFRYLDNCRATVSPGFQFRRANRASLDTVIAKRFRTDEGHCLQVIISHAQLVAATLSD
jgi:hypothetical protein